MCDSFVLLSPKEAFGIVYREAMAIGRPVISLDNGGINYAWRDEDGIIIRCSPENIYEQTIYALRKMVSTIDDYDLKHISDSTLEEFSANEVSVRIENVLREAVIGGD